MWPVTKRTHTSKARGDMMDTNKAAYTVYSISGWSVWTHGDGMMRGWHAARYPLPRVIMTVESASEFLGDDAAIADARRVLPGIMAA